MNAKDYPRGKLPEGNPVSSKEIEQLKTQIHDMKLEIDILKETLDVLKKDPGADIISLKNREKAVIIGVLKNKYSLPLLLQKLNISGSSYYYQCNRMKYEMCRQICDITYSYNSTVQKIIREIWISKNPCVISQRRYSCIGKDSQKNHG